MSLSDLEPGQSGRVARIGGRGALRQRIMDMGLLPDVIVHLERVAPAGDPIWIKLEGCQLSLRRREAASVVLASPE